jgi:hypothetical protein
MALDFVGIDPDSPTNKCPAVYVDPETGDAAWEHGIPHSEYKPA